MVFSAPEMTTVSKPKRKPASAEVSDQKKMRAFIDGKRGAYHRINGMRRDSTRALKPGHGVLLLYQRVSFFAPAPDAAIHRDDIGVSHFLQVVGRQRGTESASTIQNHLRSKFRNAGFDIALDDALSHVDGAWQVIFGEFALFAHIHKHEFVSAIHAGLYLIYVGFADARARIVDDLQEPGRVLMSHGDLLFFVLIQFSSYQGRLEFAAVGSRFS